MIAKKKVESPVCPSEYLVPRTLAVSSRSAAAFGTEVLPASAGRWKRPDPPRRCVDLQRFTTRCSRSFGFAAPPPSFRPCGLDPGVFRRTVPPAGFPFGAAQRSWPCARPRGPRLLPGSSFRFGADRLPFCPTLLPWDSSPLRRSQPEESVSRHRPPAADRSAALRRCLAAGFQPRVAPPPPFPTALTACSSSSPVVCFDHSRPWGSFPSLPAISVLPGRSCDRPFGLRGVGSRASGSRVDPAPGAPLRRSARRSFAPKRSVPPDLPP
jgi:hypothetical protein